MIVVGIYIKDSVTLEYNRVELFNDEKISVNSSIQNVNDISKTYTDFSQTFTVPASKQNNKIFRHWYENSNDNGFSTLVKADAYIEIDTIPFRSGKIQLESANVKDGQPQDYSITFIGALGSLKDKFNGLYLKDLTDTTYDFVYSASDVLSRITTATSSDVMFPLISSNRYWNYGSGDNIANSTTPIRYNELFPAIRLKPVLNMIENRFGINFDGTSLEPSTFLSDTRFTNAYLYLKNSEAFETKETLTKVNFTSISGDASNTTGYSFDLTNDTIQNVTCQGTTISGGLLYTFNFKSLNFRLTPSVSGIPYKVIINKDGILFFDSGILNSTSGVAYNKLIESTTNRNATNSIFEIYIATTQPFTFTTQVNGEADYIRGIDNITKDNYANSASQTTPSYTLQINQYFPEIKIEDFFSGLLKMFNLTCYSTDGINYTIRQLEEYYTNGQIRDITKYIKSDNINLNRVKTYKKINFEYDKSESIINKGFLANSGQEYGSLFHETFNDGDEYNIKLPFEDLNFSNLNDKLQVAYALKSDGITKYVPKPIILYDYQSNILTTSTSSFFFSTAISGTASNTSVTNYKAFGQELLTSGNTYSLNFNQQQSTLTNETVINSLYLIYYEPYLSNIFDSKARLIKVSGILPTSLLTTLKLNDRLIIRDKRYLINTFTTDLTTGEVQFELLTDFR